MLDLLAHHRLLRGHADDLGQDLPRPPRAAALTAGTRRRPVRPSRWGQAAPRSRSSPTTPAPRPPTARSTGLSSED
ncbi:MAG: hypothetical protein E6H88_10225 [Chloroflexi bacterium]|nr:MAG: hypothetical protein E6I20_14880 [Chloroflexota bacterium]TMG36183.1 MAG: hypothetical protein E6H88_10225 [Chloroflexota bacterium]